MRRLMLAVVAVAGFTLGDAAIAQNDQTIVERAVGSGQFQTLVGALKETGLDITLNEPGSFTVFAPTDAAFAAIPREERLRLLNPENREELRRLLLFHVLPDEVGLDQIEGRAVIATTAMGEPLGIDGTATPVNIGGAPYAGTTVDASNGIIHVVDEVILPPELAR